MILLIGRRTRWKDTVNKVSKKLVPVLENYSSEYYFFGSHDVFYESRGSVAFTVRYATTHIDINQVIIVGYKTGCFSKTRFVDLPLQRFSVINETV